MLTLGSVAEKRLTRSWEAKAVSWVVAGTRSNEAHLCESVPPPPKVGVGNHADCFTELCLDIGRAGNHETNEALLDGLDLCLRNLVVSFLVLDNVRLVGRIPEFGALGAETVVVHVRHSWCG